MTGAMKLQPDDGPRSSLGIRPGSNNVVGPRREFARRFTEDIGSLLGTHREIARRLTARMLDAARLAGWRLGRLYPGNRATVLLTVDLPKPTAESLVPRFYGFCFNFHCSSDAPAEVSQQWYQSQGHKGNARPRPSRKGWLPATSPQRGDACHLRRGSDDGSAEREEEDLGHSF
ncbi:hypothetical protein BHM03_00059638 [Ensete ventricosum]|nr:hypothetical protein BHM03_00059638 [Ensete ventricosum]